MRIKVILSFVALLMVNCGDKSLSPEDYIVDSLRFEARNTDYGNFATPDVSGPFEQVILSGNIVNIGDQDVVNPFILKLVLKDIDDNITGQASQIITDPVFSQTSIQVFITVPTQPFVRLQTDALFSTFEVSFELRR